MSLTNSAEKPRICECRGLAAGVYSQPVEPNSCESGSPKGLSSSLSQPCQVSPSGQGFFNSTESCQRPTFPCFAFAFQGSVDFGVI